MAFVWGFVALFGLWIISGVFVGVWNPLTYVQGFDGRPSTSKFQWCFWTAIVFFSYAALYAARARYGYTDPITTIPTNVLYAMGISATTMAAAKGITTAYVGSAKLAKPPLAPANTGVKALFADDAGVPDLSKVQMIGWTVLIGVIYLIRVVQIIHGYEARDNDLTQLPDIDTALMVLMGLGHGAYLGKKAAS